MSAYKAVARREGRYWVVDVEGVGVTQGRNLRDAREMAADLVAVMTDVDVDEVELDFSVGLAAEVRTKLEEARAHQAAAEREQREASIRVRLLAQQLREQEKLTGSDVGFILGVSEQRVSQLLSKGGGGKNLAVARADEVHGKDPLVAQSQKVAKESSASQR